MHWTLYSSKKHVKSGQKPGLSILIKLTHPLGYILLKSVSHLLYMKENGEDHIKTWLVSELSWVEPSKAEHGSKDELDNHLFSK